MFNLRKLGSPKNNSNKSKEFQFVQNNSFRNVYLKRDKKKFFIKNLKQIYSHLKIVFKIF